MTRQRGDLGLETGDNHYGPGGGGESPPESSCQGGEVEEEEDQGADWGWHNPLPHLDITKVATHSK